MPMRDTAKEITVKTWFKKKFKKPDLWFSAIDSFIAVADGFTQGEKAENKIVVSCLAAMVDTEGSLADHVVDNIGASVSDESTWLKMCTAAAWVIMQNYRTAEHKGEWPDES